MGLPLWFLLRFIEEHGGRSAFEGKTTTQVNELIVQPETAGIKASYVELLWRSDRADATGIATWFMSHAWKYSFLDVCDAARAFFVRECGSEEAADKVVIWFDLFSNSQHDTSAKAFEWWTGTFMNAIQTMGNVLMIMTPWDNPITLTRAWCVFEVYATTKTESRFEVAMTANENERFLEEISLDPGKYYEMLATINSHKATAFKEEDSEAIFEVIRREIGFTQMDSLVLRTLESWMTKELTVRIEKEDASKSGAAGYWRGVLGELLIEGGKFDEAAPLLTESLDQAMQACGLNHSDTLLAKKKLARLLQSQGKFADALVVAYECLEISKVVHGDEHSVTLEAIEFYALSLESQGRYDDAEPLFYSCWKTAELALGPEDDSTLAYIQNLAHLYKSQARFPEAKELYLCVVDKYKLRFGEDHPETLNSLENLAGLFECEGKHADALPIYINCLDVSNRVLGREHPTTLSFVNNLAACHEMLGCFAKAEELYKDCLQTKKAVLGPEHPSTLTSLSNLASIHESQGQYEEALPLLLESMDMHEAALGSEHPSTLASMTNLADCFESLGRYAQAKFLYKRCL